jgi:hypothetical protein
MGRWAKGVGLMAALGLGLSLSALAQDYEIRLHRPAKVGQTYRESSVGTLKQKLTVTMNAQVVQQKTDDLKIEFESEVTIVEVDKNGQASKESHSVIKCETVRDGARDVLLAPGSILVASAGETGTKFEAQGGPVAPNVAQALELVISVEKDSETDDQVYGTRERKKVGESWPMNSEAMASNLRRHKAEAQKENIEGTVKLASVAKVGAVQCLDIQGAISMKNIGLPMGPGFKTQKQSANITFEAQVPVDTSLGRPGESTKMHMELQAKGKPNPNAGEVTLDLTVDKSATRHRTFPK